MVKIKQREGIQPTLEWENETRTELNFKENLTKVSSKINRDIKPDFILAKLEPEHKEGIISLTSTGNYAKNVIYQLSKNSHKWEWNKKEGYTTRKLNETEQQYIKMLGDELFETYMLKSTMIAILNRNKEKNWLIQSLLHIKEEEAEEQAKNILSLRPEPKEEQPKIK